VKHPRTQRFQRGPRGPQQGPQQGDPFEDFFERYFGQPGPGGPEGPGGELRGQSLGSGFLLNPEGFILTNNHVVKDATDIIVRLSDGREFKADVVGKDQLTDVALIKLAKPPKEPLPTVVLGDSDALRQGDFVLALGSPLGLRDTATLGIVSAKHRSGISPIGTGTYDDYVQTDAAINPGNSGGPLVNLLGQVVGVNSAIATAGGVIGGDAGNIGVGFAIPIEQVRVTADQILETGEARYPVIGAKVRTGGNDNDGALIDSVVDGQPAQEAGLEEGDLVVALEGERVTDGIALIVAIRSHQPGETLEFTVERDGDERVFDVTLDSEVG
jgi:S1-C subfamily serine protease